MTTTLLQRVLLRQPRNLCPNTIFRTPLSCSLRTPPQVKLQPYSPTLRLLQRLRGADRQFFTSTQFAQPHYVRHPYPPRVSGFWDRVPEDSIFWGIIGLNGLVFAMWYMSGQRFKYDRDPTPYKWMYDNFTDSWRNLSSGRVWTLITSCFSHEDWAHILFNGFTFYFMAKPVLSILGNKGFLTLYLGGGVAANIATIVWSNIVKGQDRPSHGASAAIYSVVSFLACIAPTMTFQLYGIIPVPAWLAVAGIFSYDTYSALNDKRKGVDTAGHVAGLLAGASFFLAKRLRIL